MMLIQLKGGMRKMEFKCKHCNMYFNKVPFALMDKKIHKEYLCSEECWFWFFGNLTQMLMNSGNKKRIAQYVKFFETDEDNFDVEGIRRFVINAEVCFDEEQLAVIAQMEHE